MAFILKNGIWRPNQVPSFEVELDRAHPLTNGLVACYLPGVSYRGYVGSEPVMRSHGAAKWGSGPGGRALDSTLSNGGIYSPAITPALQLTQGTVFWRGSILGTPANGAMLIGGDYDNASNSPYVTYDLGFNASGQLQFYWNHGGNFDTSSARTVPTGEQWQLVTFQAGGIYAAMDAAGTWASGSFGPAPSYSPTSTLEIGGDNNDPTRFSNALSYIGAVWNRPLNAQEIVRLTNEPFAMFKAKVSRQFYFLSSVTGAPPPPTNVYGSTLMMMGVG